MNKDFNKFMSQLQETNQTLDFFCDFEKIESNVSDIKLSLCMLNSLIGAADLRKSVEAIWKRDRTAFRVMDILIAVRSNGKKVILDSSGQCVVLDSLFTSVDGVMEYLEETGLADIFRQKKINDLVDYVFGIETGLDSNARKNRSGHVMEKWLQIFLIKIISLTAKKFTLQNGKTFNLYLEMMKSVLILLLRQQIKYILLK